MPSISVIIPVYNDADLLRSCLAALSSQTRQPHDVVVVDNGSSDASAHVARSAGAHLVVELRRGIPAATSAGFDAATGDILARLDADSVPAPDWLERLEDAFISYPETSAVTGTAFFYGGTPFSRWFGRSCYLASYFWSMERLLGHPPLFGSNYALRREAWAVLRERVHRERADLHDDLDLSFQLRPGMTVRFDPALTVSVSARPFQSWSAFARRVVWGVKTVAVNVMEESPVRRRAARRTGGVPAPEHSRPTA